jgi:hypothetical protein
VKHDASNGVLLIGINRTTMKAVGRETVIATHREIETRRERPGTAFDLANTSPMNLCRIAILLIASHLARAAPDALRHVEVKSILLAGTERSLGDK